MAQIDDSMGRWENEGGAPGPEPLTEAEQWFYTHAGFSQRPGETEREGHLRSAREYAADEAWAVAHGLTFTWVEDEEGDAEGNHPAYGCIVRRPGSDDVLESLWGIGFDDKCYGPVRDPYARVIEAELAGEVRYVTDADEAMLAGSPEMRAMVAYAGAA